MASAELLDVARPRAPRRRMERAPHAASAVGRARAWPRMMLRFSLHLLTVTALAGCLAWPWIDQRFYWLGWLGLGGFLHFQRYALRRRAPIWTLLYAGVALAIAFHWAPAAMAYTIDADLAVGTAVVVPILLAEAVRLALPLVLVGGALARRSEGRVLPRWLGLAVLAVALETIVPTVFPWRLGYLQSGVPLLNQMVPLFGPAISTLSVFALAAIVCSAAAYARWFTGRTSPTRGSKGLERRELATAAAFAAINLMWGAWTFQAWDDRSAGRTLKMALVQVDPSYMDSLGKMQRFTRQIDADVDLVCWPESSIGCYAAHVTDFSDRKYLFKNSRRPLRGKVPLPSPNCEMLAGGKSFDGPCDTDSREKVSAYLIDREQRLVDRYDKTRLMPFGEYVPGAQAIPALVRIFGFGDDPPVPGAKPRALSTSSGARVGVMMCYEDMIPDVSQALVRDGAEVLIALINGTAFENPIALRQHRQLACFRALENRRYLLRTASTGSTCVIDPLGRPVAELPLQTEGVLRADVTLLEEATLFNRAGDVLGWTCVIAGGCLLLYRGATRCTGMRFRRA